MDLQRPTPLPPVHSLFGVLVAESETEAASTFLSVRQLPVPIELAGTFFPADGYALLQQRETISLVSKTRYSHSCGWLDGREIRKDIPDPAPSSAEAMAWHIEAKRCNWIGEFISGSMCPKGAPYSLPDEPHRGHYQCCAVSGRDKQVTLSPCVS